MLKKRVLALMLVVVLTISASPVGMAAEDGKVWETEQIKKTAGTLIKTPGTYLNLSDAVPVHTTVSFSDVQKDAWYAQYVYEMVRDGTVNGYGDEFKPTKEVTWGEALKMALTQTGYEAADIGENDHWAEGWLTTAITKKLLDADAIVLDQPITRVEFCHLLGMAIGMEPSTEASPFSDTDDGYAVLFAAKGVVNGTNTQTHTFSPDSPIQRGAACKILVLAKNLDS